MCDFTEEQKLAVWNKGRKVEEFQDRYVRKDACGAWMLFEKYGDRDSPFGWEIDHVYPKSKLEALGVPTNLINDIDNLRPMNWHNNQSKGSDFPSYMSVLKAEDNHNIECEDSKLVNPTTQRKISRLYQEYGI